MIETHFGNCLDVLPSIPDGSVDMVLCDLPYGTTGYKWDTPIDLERLWAEYYRVCKRNAAILLFAQVPFSITLGASNLRDLRYEWIWEKTCATGFLNANRMPLKQAENILVFYRALPTYNPQGLKNVEHLNIQRSRGGPRGGGRPGLHTGGEFTDGYKVKAEGYPRNVLKGFSRETQYHPTQKPVDLLEYLIRTYTHEGETILDNTMGSGSTLVAALRSGRNAIGIEQDPKYFDIACERIKAESPIDTQPER